MVRGDTGTGIAKTDRKNSLKMGLGNLSENMKKRFSSFSFRKRLLALADGGLVVMSALLANFLLSLFHQELTRFSMVMSIVFSLFCCFCGLAIFGAYHKMWRYFNRRDYAACVQGVLLGMASTYLLVLVTGNRVPVVYILLHAVLLTVSVCLFRYCFKSAFITLVNEGRLETKRKRTMLIGGGQACRMILREIANAREREQEEENPSAMLEPVCIIDDDPAKIGQLIENVAVVGQSHEIQKFAELHKIEQIIVAMPSCIDERKQRILDICSSTALPLKIVPFIGSLILEDQNPTLLNQIRDIRVEDLLGREPIRFDNANIRTCLHGKVCMVTGGGGSIGSELVRQIARYAPKQIVIVDIYENNAYEIQQELVMEYGDRLNLVTLIASVRDYYRMQQIFEEYKPQVVFHAAAHKHVPLMESSPVEAIKNNVMGTFNVATLAGYHKVEKFVMISTDKAVNPTNVMGASKRCCEMIVQYMSQQTDCTTEFVTTRFGNVLGSNGSVIPLFKKQIEQGRPVTVTHPDIIRYFMTIPEAVSLVMEAAAIAQGGEIFVLDMGQPVRIVTLAENLIRMYGKVPYQDVEIQFTGLRPGEKIREELLMDEENLQQTVNNRIYIGNQIAIQPMEFLASLRKLEHAAAANDAAATVKALHDIVPTFITPEEFNKNLLAAV